MGGNLYVRNKEDVRARLASVVSFLVLIRGDDEDSANEEVVKLMMMMMQEAGPLHWSLIGGCSRPIDQLSVLTPSKEKRYVHC